LRGKRFGQLPRSLSDDAPIAQQHVDSFVTRQIVFQLSIDVHTGEVVVRLELLVSFDSLYAERRLQYRILPGFPDLVGRCRMLYRQSEVQV
jgi:hypothetical protein